MRRRVASRALISRDLVLGLLDENGHENSRLPGHADEDDSLGVHKIIGDDGQRIGKRRDPSWLLLFWLLRSSGRIITPRAGNHDGGH
jgi:hypothetical protein